MTTEATRAPHGRTDFAAQFVVRAAMLAPFPRFARPWSFASSRDVISIYADAARALPHRDPAGREIVTSGGAALFNLRLAMRHLGFANDVRPLPDPRRLDHLADVRWGRYSPPAADEELLYHALVRCRPHHGRFTGEPVAAQLINELRRLADVEQVTLHVVVDTRRIRAVAELARMAELTRRAELGVAAGNGDQAPNGPGFADLHTGPDPRWPDSPPLRRPDDHTLGVVAVLATQDDRPRDWLLAGQVLQRLLLHAAAHHVGAAFHPQPLVLPDYRRRIQADATGGAYPQVLLRLGHAGRHP